MDTFFPSSYFMCFVVSALAYRYCVWGRRARARPQFHLRPMAESNPKDASKRDAGKKNGWRIWFFWSFWERIKSDCNLALKMGLYQNPSDQYPMTALYNLLLLLGRRLLFRSGINGDECHFCTYILVVSCIRGHSKIFGLPKNVIYQHVCTTIIKRTHRQPTHAMHIHKVWKIRRRCFIFFFCRGESKNMHYEWEMSTPTWYIPGTSTHDKTSHHILNPA